MSVERFEIRFAVALCMMTWIDLTHERWHGLWGICGILLCLAYANFPVWQKRWDSDGRP
jgi:hypothetical protein